MLCQFRRSSLLLAGLALQIAACRGCNRSVPGLVRIGFFPNVTHGQALVGNLEGTFNRHLGSTRAQMVQFTAGASAMEALSSGSIDISYVGTAPAINFYLKADGRLRVIAAAVNGGAIFVTKTARSAQDLKGKIVASPQLGNSQDIALRHWLKTQGLKIADDSRGDVTVIPLANADILGLFTSGKLEGAWVPEPWGARLIWEGGGHILVDERDLWPNRTFHTTLLVTTADFLKTRTDEARAVVRAHLELTRQWREQPARFAEKANDAFGRLTGKPLSARILDDAFSRLEPAVQPLPQLLSLVARHSYELGFARTADTSGIVDTSLLEEALLGAGLGSAHQN